MKLVINSNCRFGSQTCSFVCRGTALDSINHNEGTGFSTTYRRSRNSWVAKCDQSKRDECIVLSAWFRSEEMAFRDNFSKWIRWKLFYDNSFRLSRPKVVQLPGTRPTKYHNRHGVYSLCRPLYCRDCTRFEALVQYKTSCSEMWKVFIDSELLLVVAQNERRTEYFLCHWGLRYDKHSFLILHLWSRCGATLPLPEAKFVRFRKEIYFLTQHSVSDLTGRFSNQHYLSWEETKLVYSNSSSAWYSALA